MKLSTQLASMAAVELAARIRRREISPVEVVETFIERIEKRNKSMNAFVYFGYEDARNRAKKAETALMAGDLLGPLHGVPTAMKDLFDFKPGWVSTFGGVRAFKDFVADSYCTYAERIEKAGAILLGKTNSPTMGFRGTCDNYLFGPSKNPFNLSKNTGGSSGGSAAAVADRLVPLAEGTDGGGSIRIPAAWCGVYGYKASFGRVPLILRPNAFGSSTPFIFEGPITRTVEDAALALTALTGYDSRDPFSLDQKVDFRTSTERSIKGWKIAYSPNFDVFPVDRKIEEKIGKAVRAFEEAGAHVDEVKVGIKHPQQVLSDVWCRLIMPINVAMFENFKATGLDLLKDHKNDFPQQYLEWVEKGYRMSTADFCKDQEIRTEVYDAIESVFEKYDLLVTPTVACLQVDNASDGNTMGPMEINGETIDPLIGWCLTYFMNFSGHPAASIPAGLTDDKLPVGMQIIGRRYADTDVLAASAAFERIRPWNDIYDICASRAL